MQSNSVISHSPSFSTYSSSDRLAKIAARVVQEFQADLDFDDYLFDKEKQHDKDDEVKKKNNQEEEEEEFEFAFVCRQPDDFSPIPADQIFYNGQIRPVYPLFNTDLLFEHEAQVDNSISSTKTSSAVRLPLGKLFIQERERDTASSCSSSEADELDGVPAGTYCVWAPKSAEAGVSPGRCKKSHSTGTSKRWKFRDLLLHRSNSDGKDTLVFLAPSSKSEGKGPKEAAKMNGNNIVETKAVGGGNVRIGTPKASDRRGSHSPYKKDPVGVFANVNGVGRSLHPF